MTDKNRSDRKIGWETLLVAGLLILTFLPFLGENLYSTKGEPREAIVAVSMLESGNWILPVTFGAEIPYKPPMLAWCMAFLGWLNGGTVTEFLSRLPSALAAVIMIVAGFRLYARQASVNIAVAMALVTAGFFELFRAGTICRVDMLLTMFVVTALYAFYRQWLRHPGGTWAPSLAAVLLMSGGVLTKGPVGMLLPCMVVFVFRLMRGNRFWQTTVSVGLSAVLSLILPAMWYLAAYRQGGEVFWRLVMEENLGRFTGSMSYESHENPAWYNLLTLSYGCAPYTLLLLMSLFSFPWWKRFGMQGSCRFRERIMGWWHRLRTMDPVELFSLLAFVLIFVFYCIPKSKRSVYLLPVYPFAAYFIVRYAGFLIRRVPVLVKTYCWVIALAGGLASVVAIAAMSGLLFSLGVDAPCDMADVERLFRAELHRFLPPVLSVVALLAAFGLIWQLFQASARACFGWTMVYTLVIYWMVSGVVLPPVMNARSDKNIAAEIAAALPADAAVYAYRPDPMGMSRYYMLGYYLSDRMRLFDVDLPSNGYLVIGESDFGKFNATNGMYMEFTPVYTSDRLSSEGRQRIMLMKFRQK